MKSHSSSDHELNIQIQYRLIEQISESETRYRELVENLKEIVFKCDQAGNLKFINKAWTETLGYNALECLNHPIDHYLHIEDRQLWLNFLTQMPGKQDFTDLELRFNHKNQEIVWLELSAHSIAKGEISGSLTNITNRKLAQAALEAANEALQIQIEQLRLENCKRQQVEATLQELKQTQAKLLHTEKMVSLGHLVAGIAHEINNPINFIFGNMIYVNEYIQDLLDLIYLYQQYYDTPVKDIEEKRHKIDLDFLIADLPKLISSIQMGAERIRKIVLSLRNFSRLDEADIKAVDIHEGIDSTLMILESYLKGGKEYNPIQVIKEYHKLPMVQCYAGQMNQVFMNLLKNAIDAVIDRWKREVSPRQISPHKNEEIVAFTPIIKICTEIMNDQYVAIRIIDNGIGIDEITRKKIFDPFFTTKPVGKGTGLGLSISYQIIVEMHGGTLDCSSELGKGTEFLIQLPISLNSYS